MASGSPCVVPSREYRVSLLTKSSASPLYVLINTVVIDGHMVVMLRKATCLLRGLNALDASTSSTPTLPLSAKIVRIEWMAASQPASCPAQSWIAPAAC